MVNKKIEENLYFLKNARLVKNVTVIKLPSFELQVVNAVRQYYLVENLKSTATKGFHYLQAYSELYQTGKMERFSDVFRE